MRVVLDTNILARAVPGATGPAREVLESIASAPHVLVTAPALLDELTRVLSYPRLRAVHGLNDMEISRYIESVERASLVVPLTQRITAVQNDPDDNAVIAAAIAGQAEIICTRDRHFRQQGVLDFCAQHGVRIVDDVELLTELRTAES
jgi:putative PIN family toxin of toxin-antitoxin system